MTAAQRDILEQRFLILAPVGKDAALTQSVLGRAGIACVPCRDLAQVCAHLEAGAAGVLLVEEAITQRQNGLTQWLVRQPSWSDLPILVLTRPGADSTTVFQAMELLGTVTVLERPTRVAALVSAVRSALRARERQYQIRDNLAELDRNFQAQAVLAAIVASSDDAIISKTLEGIILTWNAGAERIFGYSAAEAIGRSITMLIPPERDTEEPSLLERLRRGERIEHFETVRVTKDGRRLDISLTVSPVRDANNRIIGASKIARDISERRQAEKALRGSEARFRMLADNMAQLAWTCDKLGNVTWYNRRWLEYTGLSFEDMRGWNWSKVQHPDHLERVVAKVRQAAQTGEVWEDTFPLRGKDGNFRWFLSRAVPIQDETGYIACWLGTNTDVTEQRALEEALRHADRRKDEFLATLAHELRNPLAPIRNSLHILRLAGRQDPATERVGEMIERQVNHMVRLVDDLLEVSRITRGKIELRKERVELAEVVRNAVETSRPMIEAGSHQLVLALPPKPLTIEGDPVRLAQILANLLNNAAKYTDRGGQIWLKAWHDGAVAHISVRDTGLGIAPEMLPRVFEMFAQINRTEARAQGGLGIGLTLVKSLVELHGGSVEAHSEGLGHGSEFLVNLPLASGSQVSDSPGRTIEAAAAPTAQRVLVVDDNRDAAQSMGILLKLLGVEVQVVFSGSEALEALPTFRPNVVLLDIGMPAMNGFEVARRIREQPEYRDLILIALTGWGQEEDRRHTQSAGFDYHLIKPADINTLQTVLLSVEAPAES